MITFEQLKAVLLQGEFEIAQDMECGVDILVGLCSDFANAKTLLDLIHIYEGQGYETYVANECIINTMMQLATFD
jgi:hypothetical protein